MQNLGYPSKEGHRVCVLPCIKNRVRNLLPVAHDYQVFNNKALKYSDLLSITFLTPMQETHF